MQKNKFIHEDIKAVCSSAAKKLFSLGVWGAVSIALAPNIAIAGGCHSRFGRRQATQNHMEPATRNTPVDNASVNSRLSPGMAALLGGFTMPDYLREEFERDHGYKPPK